MEGLGKYFGRSWPQVELSWAMLASSWKLFPGKGVGPGFSLSGSALLRTALVAEQGRRILFTLFLSSFRYRGLKKHLFLYRILSKSFKNNVNLRHASVWA